MFSQCGKHLQRVQNTPYFYVALRFHLKNVFGVFALSDKNRRWISNVNLTFEIKFKAIIIYTTDIII